MVKKGVEMEVVKGVSLPVQGKEQVIAQFVDNTWFILQGEDSGEELPVKALIQLLDTFCLAYGLVVNWQKSCGY